MMKSVILFAFVAAVSAQFDQYGQSRYSTPRYPTPGYSTPGPIINRVSNDQVANIISYLNEIYPDGSYKHAFNADNGIAAEAQGTPKDFPGNPPSSAVVSQGAFSWTSPEGQNINIRYIADENGYQPQGDSLPTPPPIPDVILRSIEYNAKFSQQKN